MAYTLTSFASAGAFRIFTFRRFGADGKPLEYTVQADLSLIRQHGISVQDLPLLCADLLQRRGTEDDPRHHTFTEDDMRMLACSRVADESGKQLHRSPRARSGPRETFRNPGAMPSTPRSDEGGWQ